MSQQQLLTASAAINGASGGGDKLPSNSAYNFHLPNLLRADYDAEWRDYLENELVEQPTQCTLTESGHLNWWCASGTPWEHVCRPLVPMVTSGDGNCLLHAASLAMWGAHDRTLTLRKRLHETLASVKPGSALWRRWKWEQMCQNVKCGLIYNEDEWCREWQALLKLSSDQPRPSANNNTTDSSSSSSATNNNSTKQTGGGGHQQQQQNGEPQQVYFESLEEFHVFLLATILRRPIFVVSDTMLHDSNGEPLAPIPFGGIYLPFGVDSNSVTRYPLVLAYDSAHFSALVLMDTEQTATGDDEAASLTDIELVNRRLQQRMPYAVVPITNAHLELLTLHFAYDPGELYDWSHFPLGASTPPQLTRDQRLHLLQDYLDVCKVHLYEPGPLPLHSSRTSRANFLHNGNSGLAVNVSYVRVIEPTATTSSHQLESSSSTDSANNAANNNRKSNKNGKKKKKSPTGCTAALTSKSNNGSSSSSSGGGVRTRLKKIFNIFSSSKTAAASYDELGGHHHHELIQPVSSTSSVDWQQRAALLPHKLVAYKTWASLFDTIPAPVQQQHSPGSGGSGATTAPAGPLQHRCLLVVKLNLAKPPGHYQNVQTFLRSALHKYESTLNGGVAVRKPTHPQRIPVNHHHSHHDEDEDDGVGVEEQDEEEDEDEDNDYVNTNHPHQQHQEDEDDFRFYQKQQQQRRNQLTTTTATAAATNSSSSSYY